MEQLGVTLEGFSFFEIFPQQNAVSLLKNGKQTVENKAMNISMHVLSRNFFVDNLPILIAPSSLASKLQPPTHKSDVGQTLNKYNFKKMYFLF